MKTALFIVDSRTESGSGHVVRCSALAEELSGRGWECLRSPVLDSEMSSGWDVVIVDHDEVDRTPWQTKSVQIIDTPRKVEASLVVCGGAAAHAGMFVNCNAKEMLVGPRYSLLRPEFSTPFLADHTDGILDVRAMSGMPVAAVATAMASASVVITYGGMRSMEAACVGAPMVVVPRNEGEELNALGLMAAGAAIYVAPEAERDAAFDICQAKAEYLLTDERKRRAMSEAGRMVVDGRGCERVADAIERLVGVDDVHTRALKALAAAEARWGITGKVH